MTKVHTEFPLKGLGKQKMAAMIERAKLLGMTPNRYLRHLVEEDLAVSEQAKSATFEELLAPGEVVDEAEVDRLVDAARMRLNRSTSRKRQD